MDKKFFSRILLPLAVLVVAVMWLLQVIPATADYFSWFSLAWTGTILLGVAGLKYLLDGIFTGSKGVISRRLTIIAGAVILVMALICLTFAIAIPENYIAPIICIVIAAAIFLGLLVTGGRKWDTADNQKAGYKNYHQRKAEEEKAEKSGK